MCLSKIRDYFSSIHPSGLYTPEYLGYLYDLAIIEKEIQKQFDKIKELMKEKGFII